MTAPSKSPEEPQECDRKAHGRPAVGAKSCRATSKRTLGTVVLWRQVVISSIERPAKAQRETALEDSTRPMLLSVVDAALLFFAIRVRPRRTLVVVGDLHSCRRNRCRWRILFQDGAINKLSMIAKKSQRRHEEASRRQVRGRSFVVVECRRSFRDWR